MKLPKWLRGPSSVSTGFSHYTRVVPFEAARLKGQIKSMHIGGRQLTLRTTYLFPWAKEEVARCWSMDGTVVMPNGDEFRDCMVVSGTYEQARHLMFTRLVNKTLAARASYLQKKRTG